MTCREFCFFQMVVSDRSSQDFTQRLCNIVIAERRRAGQDEVTRGKLRPAQRLDCDGCNILRIEEPHRPFCVAVAMVR